MIGVSQDAVAEALQVDVELAMVVANRPQDEPALQRKLWLSIAKHMIAQQPKPGAGSQAVRSRVPSISSHIVHCSFWWICFILGQFHR